MIHSNITAIKTSIFLALLIAFSCHHKKEEQKPNIIIFYADDLGWTDLGIQGSDFYQTPNIDQLAHDGVRFTDAYANAPNCAPSRACLMTGLYTPRHGIYTVANSDRGKSKYRKLIPIENTTVLNPTLNTLPRSLKNVGYNTCIAGKWHLSDDPKDYGFDKNFGGNHSGHPPSYFAPYKNEYLTDGPKGEYLPDRLTSDVINWISINKDQPFFVYQPFYLVHTPIQPTVQLEEKYNYLPKGDVHNDPCYAAMIEAMDLNIGKVLHQIDQLHLQNNTIVIFTSDNGPMGGHSVAKPLRGVKGMLYEGGIRVPQIVKWPGVTQGGSINTSHVMGSDIYPTVMEMVGAKELLPQIDGKSFVSALKGSRMKDRPLYWHFPAYLQSYYADQALYDAHDPPHFRSTPSSVIRYGDWKLHRYYENEEIELYHLKSDLSERRNLADQEQDKTNELLGLLNEWLKATNAPIPLQLNPQYDNSRK